MAAELSSVFRPASVGALRLPHRIVMGSMHLGYEAEPDAGERLAAFYRERAEGGAGLVVTGGWAVSRAGAADADYGFVNEDAGARALERVAACVEGTEAAIALQLFHAGRYANGARTGAEPVAPSPIAGRLTREVPRELGEEEVWEVIGEFVAAARRAVELGFAAVELMGSEGYLVDQFLSPLTNQRDDSWGGDAERRVRFGVELAGAVRDAVGPDFPLIFRITSVDLMPGGRSQEDVEAFAVALAAAGVDALNAGVGWHESRVPTVQGPVPAGVFAPWAGALRRAVGNSSGEEEDGAGRGDETGVPVIAGNRVNRLADAAAIIAAGDADLVSMARPFLADPELIRRERDGAPVNVCIACDQACVDRSLSAGHVSCLVNPRAGHERQFPRGDRVILPTNSCEAAAGGSPDLPARYVVIGGGPAGMEAARALAELGQRVRLLEAGDELGGQFRLARLVPGKEVYGETIRYFERELERLGVEVELGRTVGEEDSGMLSEAAAVVLAAGVVPREVEIPGAEVALDYATAFRDGVGAAERVAIVGAGGIGVDLAHLLTHVESPEPAAEAFLREHGVTPPASSIAASFLGPMAPKSDAAANGRPAVTLIRRRGRVGGGIGVTTRWVWLEALRRAGVETRTDLSYRRIGADGVEIETADGVELVDADRVVVAAGQEPNAGLVPLLEQAGVPFRVVGGAADAAELNAVRAFATGLRAAHELAGPAAVS